MGPIKVLVSNILDDRVCKVRMSYQEIDEGIGCIYLSGRLDVRSVPKIETQFSVMSVMRKSSVIIDLSGVELMNSAGLGLLITAANEMSEQGRIMILLNPPPRVARVVQIACVHRLLPIVHGLGEAIRRIRKAA